MNPQLDKEKYVISAKWSGMGIWVFLAKNTSGRRDEKGSVYYWSTHMAGSCCFDTPEEARKKLNRLKIKNDYGDVEFPLFKEGVQIVYLNK